METIILQLINWVYLATFIVLSYGITKTIKVENLTIFGIALNKAWLVFIVALILAPIFYWLDSLYDKDSIKSYIVTFAFGTSFYELILKAIIKAVEDYVSKIFTNAKNNSQPIP